MQIALKNIVQSLRPGLLNYAPKFLGLYELSELLIKPLGHANPYARRSKHFPLNELFVGAVFSFHGKMLNQINFNDKLFLKRFTFKMNSFNRRLAGRIAKAKGQNFETQLILQGKKTFWTCIQIPDGCKQVSKDKMFRIKSPFDFVFANLLNQTSIIFCDAKTTDAKTFPPGKIKEDQLTELMKFAEMTNVASGYIVNFEKLGIVSFFSVAELEKSFKSRKGLKPDDGICLGPKDLIILNNIFE